MKPRLLFFKNVGQRILRSKRTTCDASFMVRLNGAMEPDGLHDCISHIVAMKNSYARKGCFDPYSNTDRLTKTFSQTKKIKSNCVNVSSGSLFTRYGPGRCTALGSDGATVCRASATAQASGRIHVDELPWAGVIWWIKIRRARSHEVARWKKELYVTVGRHTFLIIPITSVYRYVS